MTDTHLTEATARNLGTQVNGLAALIQELIQKQDRDISEYLEDISDKLLQLTQAVATLSEIMDRPDFVSRIDQMLSEQRGLQATVTAVYEQVAAMTEAMGAVDFAE